MSFRKGWLRVLTAALLVTILAGSVSIAPGQAAVLSQAGEEDWPMLQANSQRTGWSPIELLPPYTHRWTWIPPDEDILPTVNQPVTGDGKVYIGSYTGVMYAIEDSTGQSAWSHQTGGGIMQTATYHDGRVYFTSLDFSVYCLDASSGEKIWSYETGAELVNSPLVVNDTVYVGSRDGYFYALQADTGDLKWKFETEGPIDHSAAYSPSRNLVIFGSDDMYVYALEDARSQANLQWKSEKLYGQMFGHSWPVISEPAGLVMVRTLPTYSGDYMMMGAIDRILCDLCPQACEDWSQTVTCDIWPTVEQRIRDLYTQDPYRRTFFALDLDTGQERFLAAVPYIARHEDIPSWPWVDGEGTIYVHFRSTGSFSTEFTFGTHFISDVGTVDPLTGDITTLITPAGSVSTRFSGMCLDDNAGFTMGGNIIYGTHNGGTPDGRGGGALDLTNDQAYCIFRDSLDAAPWCGEVVYDSTPVSTRGAPCQWRGEGTSGMAISGDTLYTTRARFGVVAAVRGTRR